MRRFLAFAIFIGVTAVLIAQDMPLNQVLIEGESWAPVALEVGSIDGLTADASGNVYVSDGEKKKIFRIDGEGKASEFATTIGNANRMRAGPKGFLYCSELVLR